MRGRSRKLQPSARRRMEAWEESGKQITDWRGFAGQYLFCDRDGTFDANTGGTDYGDTVLKMDADLNVLDYFTPWTRRAV